MRNIVKLLPLILTLLPTNGNSYGYSDFTVSVPPPAGWVSKDWGIYNENKIKSHIDAPKAWALVRTSRRVVVAEIDTGIQLTHGDLPNISRFGHDFVKDSNEVYDAHGHGTHIAGIIESVSRGHALIVPLRYYSDANPGSVNLRNTVKAIRYAVDHGAKIINYSGGGPEFSEDEYLAIKYAETHGVLFVAAAGNEHQNVDLVENYYYPAAYRLSNIISVMSLDINNNPLPSSNWGVKKVDVGAPGENIFSTLPGGRFGYMSGTSQATAFVTGIATMILAVRPDLSPQDVRAIIMGSVDGVPQLEGKNVTAGKVNAFQAVQTAISFTKVKP